MTAEKHPKGLYVLFFTEMWERFGFYSMLAMFTLYLKDPVRGFSWTAEDATNLYANYLMFVYASPLIGGWIADRKLGYRNSVLIGGVIFMIGYFLFTIRSIEAVYAALVCLVVGNGFFKPNVSAMVGQLYPEGSALKDRAYNIFYMGINIGALLAPINAELMVNGIKLDLNWLGGTQPLAIPGIGFHWAFATAGVGMICSVAILATFRRYVEAGHRDGAVATAATPTERRVNPIDSVPNWKRIGALIVVFLIVIVFWMVFHQNGSTLTYWADDNTNWNVSGIISNAINAFWVVTLTFPLVWLWGWLNRRGMEPSTPAKMTMGMFLTAASFFLLYAGARSGESMEVRPEQYPGAAFRVTDRSLQQLAEHGVPRPVLEKMDQYKEEKGTFLWLFPYTKKSYELKGKKFSPDTTIGGALKSVQKGLEAEGVPKEVVKPLDDLQIDADEPFHGGAKWSEVLAAAAQELIAKGAPSDISERLEKYKGKTFTGEEKLREALVKVVGPEEAAEHAPAVLQQAFLFRVSPLWLIIAYAVVTLGELMLSPMGLSLVSKVAPVHLRGVMMGGWFVATAIGNKLTMIGVYWDIWLQSTFFAVLGGMALVMGIVLLLLLRPLKKAMPGV